MTDTNFTPQTLLEFFEKQGFEREEMGDVDKIAGFTDLLAKWNARTNLVGPRTKADIAQTLFLDSLHLARFLKELPLPTAPLETWDLGAGAGIPGIPLRLVWDAGDYFLVEVREKRVLFLRTALALLKPARTMVHSGRAEQFMKIRSKAGKPADIILSRAFMPWPELLPFAGPYLATNGRLIILANTPAPEKDFPEDWKLEASRHYSVLEKDRYFWVLIRDSACKTPMP